MTDLSQEVQQELEYLKADLDLLRHEVDCISQHTKAHGRLLDTMDMILKDGSRNK